MEEIKMCAAQELRKLKEMEKMAADDLKNAPPGTLRIAKNHNSNQYYWRTEPKDTKGRYIKKSNEALIKGLAQKEYAKKMLPVIRKKIKELERIYDVCTWKDLLYTYERLSQARQEMIVPYILSEDEFAEQWIQENEIKIAESGEAKCISQIYTEKGECVRSKSEKILADKFYLMNIPYFYEVPLYLQGYGYVKPDFTILNKRTEKTYYWEHLGLMDVEDYCQTAIKKIECYEKNRIYTGKQLILTYETKDHPLNIRIAERLIKEYLM